MMGIQADIGTYPPPSRSSRSPSPDRNGSVSYLKNPRCSEDACDTCAPDVSASPPQVPQKVPLTIIIKVGTSSICDEKTGYPKLSILASLVEEIIRLRADGHRIILVTSGAVGIGMKRLGIAKRPKKLCEVQAVAAIGQGRLMSLYDDLFAQYNQPIAQVLLTRYDISERTRYLNACGTFMSLLDMGVIPIVNENDTVSIAEIRFGDNDSLSAITAGMVNADWLFLLTDVDCVYTDNPRKNPNAVPVTNVSDIQDLLKKIDISSAGSSLGTGGMSTKFIAAELSTTAGVNTVIMNGKRTDQIFDVVERCSENQVVAEDNDVLASRSDSGDSCPSEDSGNDDTNGDLLFTHFHAKPTPMKDRTWWILHGLADSGFVYVHPNVLKKQAHHNGKSLPITAKTVVEVEGDFHAHDAVRVLTRTNKGVIEVGKGLVNFTAAEVGRIKGRTEKEIEAILGADEADHVIDGSNFVLTMKSVQQETLVAPQ